jgi:hypothetical protein
VSVVLHQRAMDSLLRSPLGPVGRHIRRLADQVGSDASLNAQVPGPTTLGIQSGRLLRGITAHVEGTRDGPVGIVETKAAAYDKRTGGDRLWRGQKFYYPSFHDIGGSGLPLGGQHPWLTTALRKVFPH